MADVVRAVVKFFLWFSFGFFALVVLLGLVCIFAAETSTDRIVGVCLTVIFGLLALAIFQKNKKGKKTTIVKPSDISYPSVDNDDDDWHPPTLDEIDKADVVVKKTEKKQDNNFNEENWKKITTALKEKEAATLPLTHKDVNNEVEHDIATEAYKTALANRYINIADSGKVYQLEYEDRDGDLSKRDIKIIRVGNEDGRWYVYAFCYLRDDYRQFRFDRIAALSVDGNRIIEPQKYLFDLYFSSPAYKLGLLFENKTNELAILIFMAKADGAMRKNERDVIVEYIKSISDITDEDLIHESLKPLQVDLSAFNKILKIRKQWTDENKTLLLEWVGKVYAVKKAHDPIEEGIFKKIQEALKVKSKVNNDSNI